MPPNKSTRSHATAARQTWREYLTDPATVARICKVYEGDFAAYGYRPDRDADPSPERAVIRSDHLHLGLAKLVTYREASGKDKWLTLRDLEASDATGALADWTLAQRLRMIALNRARVTQMLAENVAQIAAGPDYLQRIAAEVRAGAPAPE